MTYPHVKPEKKHLDAAKELIANGYYQVSRSHRIVARLPEGMTGSEALLREAKKGRPWDAEEWVKALGEGHAGDHFLRCYAQSRELWKELDRPTFAAFRSLGGRTYS